MFLTLGLIVKLEVIEVSVKKGDVINAEDPLITLESEKHQWRSLHLRREQLKILN